MTHRIIEASEPPSGGFALTIEWGDGVETRELVSAHAARALGYSLPEDPCDAAPITRASELRGVIVVFTGHLEAMTRGEARARAEAVGAKVSGAVTMITGLVVAGPGAGSKLRDAEKHGTRVISEQEFIAILEKN